MRLSYIAGVAILLAVGTTPAVAQQASGNLVVTGVQLNNFQVVDGALKASGTVTGTLGGLPFTTDITNFALRPVANNPATPGARCAVLDLQLGPINLDLLGLHVDTSQICLEITAIRGGGLLGDLLCGLAGGGLPVLPIPLQQASLQASLTDLLNGALNRNLSPGRGGDDSVCTGDCVILELVLGPLNLTLLGLNVVLDDCNDGPVQVCVSASRGEGILGDLLCGLSNNRLSRLNLADITQLVSRALALAADGNLSRRDIADLRGLLAQLLR